MKGDSGIKKDGNRGRILWEVVFVDIFDLYYYRHGEMADAAVNCQKYFI